MAQVVLGLLAERIKEMLLDLKAKLFDEDDTPQTIIGKDYLQIKSQRKVEIRRAPLIKKVDEFKLCYSDLGIDSIVAYGPFYHHLEQPNTWKTAKDESWNHVLRNSDERDEYETTRLYFEALRRVEGEARALYDMDNPSIANLSSDDFIWMMIRDGCFMLQVAFVVLGGSEQLMGYTPSDPLYIGKILEVDDQNGCPLFKSYPLEDRKESTIKTAVWSMFLVGNQIPLLVLRELMRQSFFKKVINRGIWEQPLELERWVLFELLLVPVLSDARDGEAGARRVPTSLLRSDYKLFERRRCAVRRGVTTGFLRPAVLKLFSARHSGRKNDASRKANDLLHGLWLLVTGSLANCKGDDEEDVDETNVERKDASQYTSRYSVVPHTVRTAAELKQAGIVFQKVEGTRIRRMRFQQHTFYASLALPQIVVDKFHKASIYEVLFRSLIQYEVINIGESKGIVCEYLQFMRGLIRTPEDAKILAAKGIIVVDPSQEKSVPSVFMRLAIPTVTRNHHSRLRSITDELNNYTDPSLLKKLGDVLSFVVILTIIQTVYCILSYHFRM